MVQPSASLTQFDFILAFAMRARIISARSLIQIRLAVLHFGCLFALLAGFGKCNGNRLLTALDLAAFAAAPALGTSAFVTMHLVLDLGRNSNCQLIVQKKLDDLFHDTLKDIYYAEKKILTALPKMAIKNKRE